MKTLSKTKKILIGLLAAVILVIAAGIIYIHDNYDASEAALALVDTPAEGIHLIIDEEERMIFEPEDASTGIIFYPGGKVEAEAYAPLMTALAEQGILAVLVPMPANLAVLDVDAAEGLVEEYDYIEDWYMAGHSLGGSMAASYLAEQTDSDYFEGLILLAAYSTEDLSETALRVLSIYGSHDAVLNMEKYLDCADNLPADAEEIVIEGGNHAQFGDYGEQEGDGKAGISGTEQMRQTVQAIETFVK